MKKFLKYTIGLLTLFSLISSCYEETTISVVSEFEVTFINGDKSVPVKINMSNKTEGADTFEWTFEGAKVTSSTSKNPGTITYDKPGVYNIKLKATNKDGAEDVSEQTIELFEGIDIQFSTKIVESNYPPVEVEIKNETVGDNLTYLWTFKEGIPNTSTDKNPKNIVFEKEGIHTIIVEVSNGFETFTKELEVEVLPAPKTDFDWEVDFFDDDYQAPVTITLNNKSTDVISYQWTFEGGTPNTSTEENPSVLFSNVGTHAIKLEVSNGKQTRTITKTIEVLENTNLRTFENVQMGINTAHNSNTIGAFFSGELRKTLKADEVTNENGSKIDLVFLGLNSTFSFNKFLSPNEIATNGFIVIPNATQTKVINTQENCNCGASLSESQFDTMNNDDVLQRILITETPNGLLHFDKNRTPRIIIFQTEDGRKGAVKIKQFIEDGSNSYIICDIKIQKLP